MLTGMLTRTFAQTPGYSMSSAINAGTFTASGSFNAGNNSATGGFTNNYGNAANDVWYKFVISGVAATSVQISLCESGYDTYLHVLNSGGTEIYSNDDNGPICNPSTKSSIAITNLAAGTYYVVVEGYQSAAGFIDFSLSLTIPAAAAMTVSYNTPPIFTIGTAISPLSPTVTGGQPSSTGQTTITLAGTGAPGSSNGPGNVAEFDWPLATAVDAAGYVYVADSENQLIRRISPDGSLVSTFAGSGTGALINGNGTNASFKHPAGLAFDNLGNLYVADQQNHCIRKITPNGDVTTFAGNGTAGATDGTGTAARFNNPTGVAVDAAGNVYVADYSNHKIRKITPAGVVMPFAGSGSQGAANGPVASAAFRNPMSVAVDASGNVYVADRLNYMIRKISGGSVTTLAGNGTAGFQDNATGTSAQFNTPNSLAVDASGYVYVADQANNRIRKISPAGSVSTLAGAATSGNVNGTGTVVRFYYPFGLSLDSKGNVYVADYNNHSIRKMITRAFTINPALPAGLTFNDQTGVISGTPTTESPQTVYTITAYNATTTGSTNITLKVDSKDLAFSDENYIVSYTTKEGTMATDAQLGAAINDKDKVQIDIQYFDGLGRPMQTVQIKGNPDGNKDIVQPIEYDQFGREVKKYLPFAYTGSANGAYKPDALLKQATFYNPSGNGVSGSQLANNGIPVIPTPYVQTEYEASPLNRILQRGAPGDAWQPGARTLTAGRTVITDFSSNNQKGFTTTPLTNNIGSRKVVLYTVSTTGSLMRSTTTPYYGSNQLYVTIIKDENWMPVDSCLNTAEEYKDKEGRILLKRTYNKKSAVLEMLSTYYVYDDFGNLRYVLPPGANPDLTSGVPTQTVLDAFCYQYKYDSRNRLSEKKIPGKGWEFIIYNKLDRVCMTQDANQRNKSPQEWSYNKYDGLGRVVITGIWKHTGSNADANSTAPSKTHYNWLQGVYNTSTDPLWETRNNSTATGYTNVSLPQDAPAVYNTISYYDDYTAPGLPALYALLTGGATKPRGSLTSTRVAILKTDGKVDSNMLWTVNYYDNQGRLLNLYKQHYKGGGVPDVRNYDLVTYSYNFNDQSTVTQRKHYISSSTTESITISTENMYDHMGRKLKTWQAIRNAGQSTNRRTLLAQLSYNEIGQLMNKKLHSIDSTTFKQSIDYRYNERGWLSSIGDPDNITAMSVFGMKLDYNTGTNKQFNGNIGGTSWQTKVPANPTGLYQQKQSYLYTYDNLNRLVTAAYSDATGTNANKFNEELTYDMMGNILTLKRRGGSAATYVNDFSYNYTLGGAGNKLWSVTDAVSASQGGSYTYDGNGNVLTDTRNQITGITYNMLNLPSTVTRTTGNINYIYDATGAKLRKTGTETREYIDGIEYSGTAVAFISNEEGRAVPNGAEAYSYDYYLKDHLGNTRAAIKQDGSIVQVQDYYAFGLAMNPGNIYTSGTENRYKYNGKELQETGQYDYGARFYDPVIARWGIVDPLSEKMRRHSPYDYGFNNPIRFIDPDGMAPSPASIWPPWVTKMWNKWNNRSEAEKKIPFYYGKIAYEMRYEKGSHSIGTIATNFALMGESASPKSGSILTPETKTNTGSQNAIRHATLSALAYEIFVLDAAVTATLASHEENIKVDPTKREFDTYAEADMAVDYLNNAIGKAIADDIGVFDFVFSNKEIFKRVLDEAHTNGVWQGQKEQGKFKIKRVKLTDDQYEKLSNALSKKNDYAEWEE